MTSLFKQHSVKWVQTGGIANKKYDQKDDPDRLGISFPGKQCVRII